jgi:hypothetical protein
MIKTASRFFLGHVKGLLGMSLICLSFSQLHAENTGTKAKVQYDTGARGEFEITQGYRHDHLSWSLSGHKKKPNILSELTFKDMHIYQTRFGAKFTMNDYFLRGQIGYGDLGTGRVQDSDYARNDRKAEFSRAKAKITGSYTFDWKVTFGKKFAMCENTSITPFIGYFWNRDKLSFKHGRQTRLFGHKINEKIHGLHSKFRSDWDAPLVGLQAQYDVSKQLNFYGEYDFLFCVRNKGHAFWNLRNNHHGMHASMQSKRSKGFGHIGMLGTAYEFAKNFVVRAEVQYTWLESKGGKSHAHEHHMKITQPFHRSKLMSSEARLCLDYNF